MPSSAILTAAQERLKVAAAAEAAEAAAAAAAQQQEAAASFVEVGGLVAFAARGVGEQWPPCRCMPPCS